jgi:hypothetical protein
MKTALVMIAVTGLAAGRITGGEFFAVDRSGPGPGPYCGAVNE